MLDRQGLRQFLFPDDDRVRLLLFSSPACNDCNELLRDLAKDKALSNEMIVVEAAGEPPQDIVDLLEQEQRLTVFGLSSPGDVNHDWGVDTFPALFVVQHGTVLAYGQPKRASEVAHLLTAAREPASAQLAVAADES